MSQHDFVIANQTANSARLDINAGLQALASNNSGNSEPSTTYANMWWYETDTNLLKIRNENDSAWINVAYVDQANSVYAVLDNTKLVNTTGAQTGLLGGQLQNLWNAGTGTTESLISPANLKGAIDALTVSSPIKAWANINGNNGVIRASFGVSSVTRNSTGDYSVTFNTGVMPDANYAMIGSAGYQAYDNRASLDLYTQTQTVGRFLVTNHGNLYRQDCTLTNVMFIR